MKTRIPVRKDAEVLVAASKQIGQFDLAVINQSIRALSEIFIRVGDLLTHKVKVGMVNQVAQASESVVARGLAAGENLASQTQANVMDEAAGKEYIKVISLDGMHVGNVERVFADKALDQITHLLISREIPAQDRKLIPIKWVQTMDDAAVHLRVTKDLVEELADASIIW